MFLKRIKSNKRSKKRGYFVIKVTSKEKIPPAEIDLKFERINWNEYRKALSNR
jgi:hypothetical protein